MQAVFSSPIKMASSASALSKQTLEDHRQFADSVRRGLAAHIHLQEKSERCPGERGMYGVELDDDVADLAELVHPMKDFHGYVLHDDLILAESNLPLLSFLLFLDACGDICDGSGYLMQIFFNARFRQYLVLWRFLETVQGFLPQGRRCFLDHRRARSIRDRASGGSRHCRLAYGSDKRWRDKQGGGLGCG